MASQVITDEVSIESRFFHGRTIKVTMCDTDPEFSARVAQIQNDVLARAQMPNSSNNIAAVIANAEEVEMLPESELTISDNVSVALSIDVNQVEDREVGNTDEVTLEETFDPVVPGSPVETVSENTSNPTDFKSNGTAPTDIEQDNESTKEDNMSREGHDSVPTEIPDESFAPQPQAITEYDGIDSHSTNAGDEVIPSVDYSPDHGTALSVFNRVELTLYSEYEWKGTTPKAAQMRLGYQEIINVTSRSAMRKIRGDNYCGLRATCFQILSQKLSVLETWGSCDELIDLPQTLLQSHRCSWLAQWSFAGRLKVTPKKRLDTLKSCLQNFCDEVQISRSIDSDEERINHFLDYFNSGKPDEVLLFEAMKLLMLHSAVLLHERMAKEEDVPVFAWLLFARDTSENPEQLMLNHLNTAGDTGGLEQVEMFLLGYALNITLRVMRPSQVGEEDFVTHYPDDHLDDWDICNLIAEDDRHYNIIVP